MSVTYDYSRTVKYGSSAHPVKTKRKKGTFSLHCQQVMVYKIGRPVETTVCGIRVHDGIKVGYIRQPFFCRVRQLGLSAWEQIKHDNGTLPSY